MSLKGKTMKKIFLFVAFFFVFSAKGMDEFIEELPLKDFVLIDLDCSYSLRKKLLDDDIDEVNRYATIKLPFSKKKIHDPRWKFAKKLLILLRSATILDNLMKSFLDKKSRPVMFDFVRPKSKGIADFCKRNKVLDVENLYVYPLSFTQKVILKIFPCEQKKIDALKKRDMEILDKIIKDTSRIYKKSCDEQEKIESQKKEFEDKLKDAKRIYCDVVVRCSNF